MKEFILSCLRGFFGIKPPKPLTAEQQEIKNKIDHIAAQIDTVKEAIRRNGGMYAPKEYFRRGRELQEHQQTLERILERQKQD